MTRRSALTATVAYPITKLPPNESMASAHPDIKSLSTAE